MVGPVMRALVRNVATAVEGASLEPHSAVQMSWQPLAFEHLSSTRTPSSADGGLSSLSSPRGGSESIADTEMFEEVSFEHMWPLSNEAGVEAQSQDFDFDDGFALPPPALGLEESGLALDTDDAEDMDIVLESPCSMSEMQPVAHEVPELKVDALPQGDRPAQKAQKEARATVACLRELMRLEERSTFSAMMEHWANPARRDNLRRKGAVRVGRRRVALRQRPTPPTSRRCAPCSGR